MSKTKSWGAAPIIAITLLLVVAAAALLGARNTPRSARGETDRTTARQAQPQARQQAKPESRAAVLPQRSSAGARQSRPARSKPAARPARPVAVPHAAAPKAGARSRPAAQPQAEELANVLGWRLGTQWTVKVEKFADYLAEARTITTSYRYTVVGADPAGRSFTVSMRYADLSIQPEDARGDLMVARYTVQDGGALELAWLQPEGRGPQMPPEVARGLLGNNSLPMAVPAQPFTSGTTVQVQAPGLGQVQGNRLVLGSGETATFARGVPWWVSYSKGDALKATLTGFTR